MPTRKRTRAKHLMPAFLLVLLLITLEGCQSLTQPGTATSQHTPQVVSSDTAPTSTPIAQDMESPTPSSTEHPPESPMPVNVNQWRGIIPGQSTQADVETLLGQPARDDAIHATYGNSEFYPTWEYGTPAHELSPIYKNQGEGIASILFKDDVVLAVYLVIGENDWYNVSQLTSEFGEPSIIFYQSPRPPANLVEKDVLLEQGIDWRETTIYWMYIYPPLGIGAVIGDWQDDPPVPVWYPQGTLPSPNVSILELFFFEPMGVDEWRDSEFYPSPSFTEIAP